MDWNETFNHDKLLMLKCGGMQKKISSRVVVCGSHGACLDCMMPGVEVTVGLLFVICVQIIYVIMKIVTPCFNRPSLLSKSLVG